MKEQWKDIPGYKGIYQASNLGRVRSVPRVKPQTVFRADGLYHEERWKYKGKVLSPVIESERHIKVRLYDLHGYRTARRVSSLVLQCFKPELFELVDARKAVVTYADGDFRNCALSNLYVIPKRKKGK